MRAVEDRPEELMMSFGDQILQYVTDETKMRPPLEERGRMIDVANLASKYYATLRAEAREKNQPWTARGAANTRGGARLSIGRAVRSCRRHTSSAVSSCRSQLRGADRMAPSSFHRSAPALADHISARGDACRDRQASTERVQVEWERCDRLADGERSRKRRMERDETAIDEQREKRRKRPDQRSQAQRRQRERMEAGSSQSGTITQHP